MCIFCTQSIALYEVHVKKFSPDSPCVCKRSAVLRKRKPPNFASYMSGSILHNWEKKSRGHHKSYQQFLKRADKNKTLQQLPRLHAEAFEKVDCLSCANCCKNYSPRFKTPDVKRIAKYLGLKESVFIDTYLRVDEDGDFVIKASPCPFLDTDNTCKIYDQRPSDCARFPYTDEDVFIKRQALTLKNSEFCPISYYVLEKLVNMNS